MRGPKISQPLTRLIVLVAAFLCSVTLVVTPGAAVDQNAKVIGKAKPLVDPNIFCGLSYNTCQNGQQYHCARKNTEFGCRLFCLPLHIHC